MAMADEDWLLARMGLPEIWDLAADAGLKPADVDDMAPWQLTRYAKRKREVREMDMGHVTVLACIIASSMGGHKRPLELAEDLYPPIASARDRYEEAFAAYRNRPVIVDVDDEEGGNG